VFERIGFLLAMGLLVAFLLIFVEKYRWYSGIIISLVTVFAIYGIFKMWLDVPLRSDSFVRRITRWMFCNRWLSIFHCPHPTNLFYAFFGSLMGTVIGVLPASVPYVRSR